MVRKTLLLLSVVLLVVVSAIYVLDWWNRNRDSDGDGISDYQETTKYHTDPNKPDPLLAYALKKLDVESATKLKDVNDSQISRGLVDLLSSLSIEKRSSPEVNSTLNSIILDREVTEQERLLFDGMFVNPTPPLITDLNYIPTRIINDKIYDLNVSFVAQDQKVPITYAELRFIPEQYYYMIEKYGMANESYNLAFPPEKERIIVLRPKDGSFDSLREEFEVSIKDIVGGREYKIFPIVRNLAGIVGGKENKTTYIRKNENLGKMLFAKGIIVAANYFPYYPEPHPWEGLEPMAVHPLLGKYNVTDPNIINLEVDEETGHGVNTLFFSYVPTWYGGSVKLLKNIENFLSNPISKEIHVAIQYEGVAGRFEEAGVKPDKNGMYYLSDSKQWQKIIEDMLELDKLFFRRDNYLRIKDRPAIYFYASASLVGSVLEFRSDLDKNVEMFIISDHAHPWAATSACTINNTGGWVEECDALGNCELISRARNFDGWNCWAAGWYTPIKDPLNKNYPIFLNEGYKVWSRMARKYNKVFVASIIPGFINLRDVTFPRLRRDVAMFKQELKVALNCSSFIKIDTYNEFGEATGIEPTREEGFEFLQTLRETLVGVLDIDGDMLTGCEEMSLGTDPFIPNPVLGYALKNLTIAGNRELAHVLAPLDLKGKLDEGDKAFVERIRDLDEKWVKIKGILSYVANDSRVTREEISLIDSISIIPTLIPDFEALESIPARVYKGKNFEEGQIFLGDALYAMPGEGPVTIDDIATVHYDLYTQLLVNVHKRRIIAHDITSIKNEDKDILRYLYIGGYEFQQPYEPSTKNKDLNPEVIGGCIGVWDGSIQTLYNVGFQWMLNPWNVRFGDIDTWEKHDIKGADWKRRDTMPADTKWHSIIYVCNVKNDYGYVIIDNQRIYKTITIPYGIIKEWPPGIPAVWLSAELINAYPGYPTEDYAAMTIANFRNYFLIWIPYKSQEI